MRKQIFILLSSNILAILLLLSCNKVDDQQNRTDLAVKNKIDVWINKQKLPVNLKTSQKLNETIKSVQDNLDYDKTRYENKSATEKFIIIPIKNQFKSRNNNGKNPINSLVLVLNNTTDQITHGNIIQFVAATGKKTEIPANTFSKMFKSEKLDVDGKFTVLSIADYFRYEHGYKNGLLRETAHPTRKSAKNKRTICVDWYLVTTLYNPDGSVEVYEEYLYTNCFEDNCDVMRIANGRVMPDECTGGGGGSDIQSNCISDQVAGTAVSEVEEGQPCYETDTTRCKDYNWIVYRQNMGLWHINVSEKGWHKKNNGRWEWDKMECNGIGVKGIVVGGSVEPKYLPPQTVYFGSTKTFAGVSLKYEIKFSIVCKGFPIYDTIGPFTANGVFSL